MEATLTITPRVINTITSLPAEDRDAITTALARELILGQEVDSLLSPMQAIVYAIVKHYVKQDSMA